MADLKTPWTAPPVPDVGTSGDGVTARGGDPNIDAMGTSGLQAIWTNDITPDPSATETPNSVSGLPTLPSRFEPSGTPPPPPSLQDRIPGTIDEQ